MYNSLYTVMISLNWHRTLFANFTKPSCLQEKNTLFKNLQGGSKRSRDCNTIKLEAYIHICITMPIAHVIHQRAAIQQSPGLAAQAHQERLARDLHNTYFRPHRTRRGGGRGGRGRRSRRRDTLQGRVGMVVMLSNKAPLSTSLLRCPCPSSLPPSTCPLIHVPSASSGLGHAAWTRRGGPGLCHGLHPPPLLPLLLPRRKGISIRKKGAVVIKA